MRVRLIFLLVYVELLYSLFVNCLSFSYQYLCAKIVVVFQLKRKRGYIIIQLYLKKGKFQLSKT